MTREKEQKNRTFDSLSNSNHINFSAFTVVTSSLFLMMLQFNRFISSPEGDFCQMKKHRRPHSAIPVRFRTEELVRTKSAILTEEEYVS